ncbi:MAG TPA: amidase [Candidatus Acidoferrales bacterium]|nr:amidase [Candidatus Acidoferrales bacterium]
MASLVRDGAITPTELVEEHLRQIERRNPAVNAFVAVRGEKAVEEARALDRGDARGLLYGVPVTVKDSFDIAGMPTRVGSLSRPETPAAEDATVVARLRRAGAIILGRTNTPEMLSSYDTDNAITGRTNNPWNLGRTPGGSSGGEAAAIAAYCSPGGIGSDGGGSIRIPAHFCGIAGFKPTPGRIPGTGHIPCLGHPAGLMTGVGPMARSAKDLRLLFSALAGYDPQDPFSVPAPLREPRLAQMRIGVWEQFYAVPVHPEIKQAVARSVAMLEAQGFTVEGFEPRGIERAPNVWAFLFSQWPNQPGDTTAAQVLTNLAARDRMRAAFLRQLEAEAIAALAAPVFGVTAYRHGETRFDVEGRDIGFFQAAMPVVVANVLGLPAVTLPMALSSEGLPIGVQLIGRPYEDELLLELAIRLEEARGVWQGIVE